MLKIMGKKINLQFYIENCCLSKPVLLCLLTLILLIFCPENVVSLSHLLHKCTLNPGIIKATTLNPDGKTFAPMIKLICDAFEYMQQM